MFYEVLQTIYCLGIHTYVENHKGNDKMNDRADRTLRNNKLKLSGEQVAGAEG